MEDEENRSKLDEPTMDTHTPWKGSILSDHYLLQYERHSAQQYIFGTSTTIIIEGWQWEQMRLIVWFISEKMQTTALMSKKAYG